MRKPILTLTTDFGLADHYAGTMKGVILGICPQAQIVDITHEVPAYGILEAAYTIAQAYPFFPRGTTHIIVVDPGVGSERRPILVEAAGHAFVAPDNGVLSLVFSQEKYQARLISNRKLFRQPLSQTFHGRDIFAPVGAHLAAGLRPAAVGKIIRDPLRAGFTLPQQIGPGQWIGRVLKVDRFGNLITNLRAEDFPGLEAKDFVLTVGTSAIRVLAPSYSGQRRGELFVIVGSSGYLEVSSNQESAARLSDSRAGLEVALTIG